MRSFRVAGRSIESSIAIDSSTRKNTTVTSAVELSNRSQEFELLDDLSAIARRENASEFKLFSSKAQDIDVRENEQFFEQVVETYQDKLVGYHHVRRGNETPHEIEAVHTALLVDSVLAPYEDCVTIIDGGAQKARPAVNALTGIRDTIPSVTHCFKSEIYYPKSLLADLAASYLSYLIRVGEYDYSEPLLRVPHAKRTEDRWGEAFSAMKTESRTYRVPDLSELRGNSPSERAQCWYHGGVAREGAESPPSDSVTPIIKLADENGFESAKAELERLR